MWLTGTCQTGECTYDWGTGSTWSSWCSTNKNLSYVMFAKHSYITGLYTVFLLNILAFLLFRSPLILVPYINIVFPRMILWRNFLIEIMYVLMLIRIVLLVIPLPPSLLLIWLLLLPLPPPLLYCRHRKNLFWAVLLPFQHTFLYSPLVI